MAACRTGPRSAGGVVNPPVESPHRRRAPSRVMIPLTSPPARTAAARRQTRRHRGLSIAIVAPPHNRTIGPQRERMLVAGRHLNHASQSLRHVGFRRRVGRQTRVPREKERPFASPRGHDVAGSPRWERDAKVEPLLRIFPAPGHRRDADARDRIRKSDAHGQGGIVGGSPGCDQIEQLALLPVVEAPGHIGSIGQGRTLGKILPQAHPVPAHTIPKNAQGQRPVEPGVPAVVTMDPVHTTLRDRRHRLIGQPAQPVLEPGAIVVPCRAGHTGDRIGAHHVERIAILDRGPSGGLRITVRHFPQIGMGQTVAVSQFVADGGEGKRSGSVDPDIRSPEGGKTAKRDLRAGNA
jgi:hypothetical protein